MFFKDRNWNRTIYWSPAFFTIFCRLKRIKTKNNKYLPQESSEKKKGVAKPESRIYIEFPIMPHHANHLVGEVGTVVEIST